MKESKRGCEKRSINESPISNLGSILFSRAVTVWSPPPGFYCHCERFSLMVVLPISSFGRTSASTRPQAWRGSRSTGPDWLVKAAGASGSQPVPCAASPLWELPGEKETAVSVQAAAEAAGPGPRDGGPHRRTEMQGTPTASPALVSQGHSQRNKHF